MKEKINIEKFISVYTPFIKHPTWTDEKDLAHGEFISEISKYEGVRITTKTNYYGLEFLHQFTIIRVPNNKRGYLKPYRSLLTLILAVDRFGYNFYVHAMPLKEESLSSTLKSKLNSLNSYVESPTLIRDNLSKKSNSELQNLSRNRERFNEKKKDWSKYGEWKKSLENFYKNNK